MKSLVSVHLTLIFEKMLADPDPAIGFSNLPEQPVFVSTSVGQAVMKKTSR